jgi:glycogen operon protein
MGVDGFRFDLATTLIRDSQHRVDQDHEFKRAVAADPVFEGIKMIAEPWDLGPDGYQVGGWGPRWSEWNDRFRDYLRDYWRSQVGGVKELATRLCGSSDLYDGRPIHSTVNFIAAHDGFTLHDVVSYNSKHNQANGEGNRDGSNDNRSWNCGAEGETDDAGVMALRHRQARNLLASLLLADGVPMILAGDEMGRTQQGNNNAYCQDGPIGWVNWESADEWADLTDLARRLMAIREAEPLLSPDDFRYHDPVLLPDGTPSGRLKLAWMNEYSGEMGAEDWDDPGRRLLGMYVSDADSAFLLWFYSGAEPLEVKMPPEPWGEGYEVLAHTGEPGELPESELAPGEGFVLPGRTLALMRVRVA